MMTASEIPTEAMMTACEAETVASVACRSGTEAPDEADNRRNAATGDATYPDKAPQQPQREGIPFPHRNDVLYGRGKESNKHPGNAYYRFLVGEHKRRYLEGYPNVSQNIVDLIKGLDPPGRFLRKEGGDDLWYEVQDKKAREKTRQCLTEGAPHIREIEHIIALPDKRAMTEKIRVVSDETEAAASLAMMTASKEAGAVASVACGADTEMPDDADRRHVSADEVTELNRAPQQPQRKGIHLPHRNDVLCGKGRKCNNHPGNIFHRFLVGEHKRLYLEHESRNTLQKIVDVIKCLDPPGRFLEEKEGLWYQVQDSCALAKTRQCLCEDEAHIRSIIEPRALSDGRATIREMKATSEEKEAAAFLFCLKADLTPPKRMITESSKHFVEAELTPSKRMRTEVSNGLTAVASTSVTVTTSSGPRLPMTPVQPSAALVEVVSSASPTDVVSANLLPEVISSVSPPEDVSSAALPEVVRGRTVYGGPVDAFGSEEPMKVTAVHEATLETHVRAKMDASPLQEEVATCDTSGRGRKPIEHTEAVGEEAGTESEESGAADNEAGAVVPVASTAGASFDGLAGRDAATHGAERIRVETDGSNWYGGSHIWRRLCGTMARFRQAAKGSSDEDART